MEKVGHDPIRYETWRRTKVNQRRNIETSRRRQNRSFLVLWDKCGGNLFTVHTAAGVSWRDHVSGIHSEQENLSFRCKGRIASGGPTSERVPIRSTGAESPVVVRKVL